MNDNTLLIALVIAMLGLATIVFAVLHDRNPYKYEWKYFGLYAALQVLAAVFGLALNNIGG